MLIYKITNKINGKIYIGQTIGTLAKRWKEHKVPNSKCTNLGRAIAKYGVEAFEMTIIARCDSMAEMNHREVYYIKLFNTLAPNGYDLRLGGASEGVSDITRARMSVARKGKNTGKPSWNKGLSSWSKGLNLSEAHKKAIGEGQARKPVRDSSGRVFASISEAAKVIGTSSGKICAVLNGQRKHTKGYTFEVLK